MNDLAAIARAEYDKRFHNCLTMHRADQFTQQIADRLHNWERIAWLLDPAGRDSDERLIVGADELDGMAAEARTASQTAMEKADGDPDNRTLHARASGLLALYSEINARAVGLRRANEHARSIADQSRNQRKAA